MFNTCNVYLKGKSLTSYGDPAPALTCILRFVSASEKNVYLDMMDDIPFLTDAFLLTRRSSLRGARGATSRSIPLATLARCHRKSSSTNVACESLRGIEER